jgi:integrase
MQEPDQPPRRLDYATFEAILAHMPDTGQRTAGDSPRATSQTKARLRVIAYTGLPHTLVAAIKPEHFIPSERLLYVTGRHKGAGTGDRWHPLSAKGVEAVAGLLAAKATGEFSRSAMHTSFTRAARKVGRPELRPYDLRHLFGQSLLRLTKNRAVTRDLMLHRSDKTTARYVAAEIPGELRAALALFDADVLGRGGGDEAAKGQDVAAK